MDLKEIQNFIRFLARSGASEVKVETKDLKLTVRTGHATTHYVPDSSQLEPSQVFSPAPQPASQSNNKSEEESKFKVIKSPMIGTFYRKPSPEKKPFVEVGQTVSVGDVLCVIEAMKLFNEMESEVSGKIVKILVDDMSPVEFGQPLFLVDPS